MVTHAQGHGSQELMPDSTVGRIDADSCVRRVYYSSRPPSSEIATKDKAQLDLFNINISLDGRMDMWR